MGNPIYKKEKDPEWIKAREAFESKQKYYNDERQKAINLNKKLVDKGKSGIDIPSPSDMRARDQKDFDLT